MAELRTPLPLKPHEDRILRRLYLRNRFPVDQYAQRPRALAALVEDFNRRADRDDSTDDVRHYMLYMRKRGRWVTFDGKHKPLRSPKRHDLTAPEWAALEAAYTEIGEGRDQYGVDSDLRHRLVLSFQQKCRSTVSGDYLYSAAMAMQKHWENLWPKVRRVGKAGWGDASEVA